MVARKTNIGGMMATFWDELKLKDSVSNSLKKIQENSQKLTEKFKKVTASMNQTGTAFSKFPRTLYKLDAAIGKTSENLDRLAKKTENIKKLGQGIQSFGNKLTVGVTLPIVGLGAAMVKSAADMEAMQAQLSTMLQSEEKGAKMFDDIKKMAAKTPFGTKDLMGATNTMLGFGIAQEKVLPLMRQLGDIAGGDKQRFQSLALAFSQVSSAGKLQGQDLMQMINAGFNPLEAISKRTGKSIGQLKDEMSKGKITIDMVEQAMKDATSEGGRFFNMMDKQSKTGLGQFSTLMDNLNQTLADFGVQILPYAIQGMKALSALFEKFNSLSPGMKKFIIILGAVVAGIGPVITTIGGLITGITAISTALTFLATTFSVSVGAIIGIGAGVVAAIAAIIAIVVLLWKNWDKVMAGIKKITSAVCNFVVGLFDKIASKIAEIVGKIGSLGNIGANIKIGGGGGGGKTVNNTTNNSTTTNNYFTTPKASIPPAYGKMSYVPAY